MKDTFGDRMKLYEAAAESRLLPLLPTFDARVWQVPNQTEGANVFLWRELDATRNSISMAAHGVFGAKRLHGKSSNEKQAMLLSSGINWNDYPAFFKRGVYVQRRLTTRAFKDTDNLPEKHLARRNPGLVVERSEWVTLDMPPLATVINREDVIFKRVAPQVAANKEDQSRC